MGTATNQIADYNDINSLSGISYFGTTQCPKKSNILSAYSNVTIGGSYDDNQCVKYSDLSASEWIEMTFYIYNRTESVITVEIETQGAAEIFYGDIAAGGSVTVTANWHVGHDEVTLVLSYNGTTINSWEYTVNESRAVCDINIY